MLSFMREKAGSWFIKAILFAIIVVFVLWGVGSFNENRRNEVASINGEGIDQNEFNRAYNNQIDNLRRQFQNNLTPELIEQLGIKKQVLDGLISKKLMIQEAKRLNLRVTDQELVDTIHGIEAFKTAGVFDPNRFKAIMTQLRIPPETFEEIHRQDMLIEKLQGVISSGILVSDEESRQWFDYNNSTVNIAYVLFSPEAYKNIDPSEADLKAFFEKNSASYKTEPLVKVQYLKFSPENYKAKAIIDPSDVSDYYESAPNEFRIEKTIEVRQIVVKVSEIASSDLIEKARQKALDILKDARSNKDFSDLANKFSDENKKGTGGYLGFLKRGDLPKSLADVAFSMAAGEISEPILTNSGWVIIKVENVKEASIRPLDEVEKSIREKLSDKKAKELAFEAAESAYDIAFADGTMEKIAATLKMELKTTGFFNKSGDPLDLAEAKKFAAAAFELEDKAISNVIELKSGYMLIQKLAFEPERIPDISAVKATVRQDLIKQLQTDKAKADAEACLAVLKGGVSMETEATKLGKQTAQTGFFKRNEAIPQIGNEREIAKVAFELSTEKKFPDTVFMGTKGAFVIQFIEKKMPDPNGFEGEKKKIEQQLLKQKERAFLSEWLDKLKAKSKIEIREPFRN